MRRFWRRADAAAAEFGLMLEALVSSWPAVLLAVFFFALACIFDCGGRR